MADALSTHTDAAVGRASGWRVQPDSYVSGLWRWHAYGRLGGEMGSAPSQAVAERRAREAESRLRGQETR